MAAPGSIIGNVPDDLPEGANVTVNVTYGTQQIQAEVSDGGTGVPDFSEDPSEVEETTGEATPVTPNPSEPPPAQ